MSKKTVVALVGRGHWGQVYKKTIAGMNNVVLYEQNTYGRDYKRIKKANTSNIDGIIIAVSTSAHYEVSSYLLRHGFKNLLIEKPLTQTYNQAKKLQKLIQSFPDAKVMVGHTLLYDPAYNKIKEVYKEKLGKAYKINYFSLKTPPIKNATLLQDAGSPPIYLFLDFANRNPVKISATPKENDNIELTLVFNNGLTATANIGSIYPERKRGIVVTGEKGKLMLNEFMNPRKLVFIDNSGKKKRIEFPKNQTSLEMEIEEFIDFINCTKKPKTPYFKGVIVVKIIELAEKSFQKKGQTVYFR